MAITTSETVTIPPQSEVVCDKLWIQLLDVRTTNYADETVTGRMVFRYYGVDGDGNKVWATGPDAFRSITISDLFADAANDADVAACLGMIYTAAGKYVAAQDAANAPADSSSSSGEGQ